MLHLLLIPFGFFAGFGRWVSNTVLSPFALGMTAKQVLEEQIGVFGVLAYLIFKASKLVIDYFPLCRPQWLVGRALRAGVLCGVLVVLAYLLSAAYIGTLIAVLGLNVSIVGVGAAATIAWIALGYRCLTDAVKRAREAAEAEEMEE